MFFFSWKAGSSEDAEPSKIQPDENMDQEGKFLYDTTIHQKTALGSKYNSYVNSVWDLVISNIICPVSQDAGKLDNTAKNSTSCLLDQGCQKSLK